MEIFLVMAIAPILSYDRVLVEGAAAEKKTPQMPIFSLLSSRGLYIAILVPTGSRTALALQTISYPSYSTYLPNRPSLINGGLNL